MNIAVLGTGQVGRALAGKFDELGHDVAIGTRDPEATLASTERDARGNPSFAEWHGQHEGVEVLALPDAGAFGEAIVNATSGLVSLEALRATAGDGDLAGKLIVDVANPLDFSTGFPPTLAVKDTDSLAEQLQRAFPDADVVKTLNTMNNAIMVNPGAIGGGDHTVFVSGDHAQAKQRVTELLEQIGWRDIVDLGDLSTARGTEMLVATWVRLVPALGTNAINFKIVR
jgi:hypothetical protein